MSFTAVPLTGPCGRSVPLRRVEVSHPDEARRLRRDPAQNERSDSAGTPPSLTSDARPGELQVVFRGGCTDDTAVAASTAGVDVMEIAEPGKGTVASTAALLQLR